MNYDFLFNLFALAIGGGVLTKLFFLAWKFGRLQLLIENGEKSHAEIKEKLDQAAQDRKEVRTELGNVRESVAHIYGILGNGHKKKVAK